MKKILYYISALFVSLLNCSCEHTIPDILPTTDEHILTDFKTRFPSADIVDISNWSDGKTDICFTDADGLDGVAVYLDGIWMITEKTFNTDEFLYTIPRKVARTYIGTGIENEDYNSDNFYVIEVSRNGLDKKQYEFNCVAPFVDGTEEIDNLQYDIVIDEDGTLLTCSHSCFNRSIWWYDIRSSIDCVRKKYGDVPILGAVNDAGSNVLFIRDNGIRAKKLLRFLRPGNEMADDSRSIEMMSNITAAKQVEHRNVGKDFVIDFTTDTAGRMRTFRVGTAILEKVHDITTLLFRVARKDFIKIDSEDILERMMEQEAASEAAHGVAADGREVDFMNGSILLVKKRRGMKFEKV